MQWISEAETSNRIWTFKWRMAVFSRKFQASKAEILGDMSGESLGRHLFGNPTRYQALQASASGRRHEWYRAGPALCSENSAQRRQRRRCWRRMEGSRPRPSRTIRRSSLWLGAAVDLGEGWCVWCAIANTPLSFEGVSCDLLMLNICLDHENYIDYIWCMDKRRSWYGGAISSQLLVILVAFRMAPSMESNLLNSDLISCCLALKVCDFSPWWTTVDHCGPGDLAICWRSWDPGSWSNGPRSPDGSYTTAHYLRSGKFDLLKYEAALMQIAWKWLEHHRFIPFWSILVFSNLLILHGWIDTWTVLWCYCSNRFLSESSAGWKASGVRLCHHLRVQQQIWSQLGHCSFSRSSADFLIFHGRHLPRGSQDWTLGRLPSGRVRS